MQLGLLQPLCGLSLPLRGMHSLCVIYSSHHVVCEPSEQDDKASTWTVTAATQIDAVSAWDASASEWTDTVTILSKHHLRGMHVLYVG